MCGQRRVGDVWDGPFSRLNKCGFRVAKRAFNSISLDRTMSTVNAYLSLAFRRNNTTSLQSVHCVAGPVCSGWVWEEEVAISWRDAGRFFSESSHARAPRVPSRNKFQLNWFGNQNQLF